MCSMWDEIRNDRIFGTKSATKEGSRDQMIGEQSAKVFMNEKAISTVFLANIICIHLFI